MSSHVFRLRCIKTPWWFGLWSKMTNGWGCSMDGLLIWTVTWWLQKIGVTMCPGTMSKVQSGTIAVIYKLLDACCEDMQLEPMLKQFRNSLPLWLTDLRPGLKSGCSFSAHTLVNIAGVLFIDAISCSDFGCIEDILPDLACIFRGAGSNNYSNEILHFLHNIKEVWTPQFVWVLQIISSVSICLLRSIRNIMHDSMLVNPSGLPGHFIGTDLNIKHLQKLYVLHWG